MIASTMSESRPFLGVERSASGRVWRDRLDARANQTALALVQRLGLPELLARVLAGRGVTADDAEAYLDPTVKSLMPDPDTLTDMPAAATRSPTRSSAASRSRCSAITTWTAPPRPRCWCACCAPAGSIRCFTF